MSESEYLAVVTVAAVIFLGLLVLGMFLSYKQLPCGRYEKNAFWKGVSIYGATSLFSCGMAGWLVGEGFLYGVLLPFEWIVNACAALARPEGK